MCKIIVGILFVLFSVNSFGQSIIGKWKTIYSVWDVKTNDSEATKIISADMNAYVDIKYGTYIRFANNGRYTDHVYNLETDASYRITGNELEISGSSIDQTCRFSINGNTLKLVFDYTDRFLYSDGVGYDVPDPESVKFKHVKLYTYLERLPDDFSIEDAVYAEMIRDSVIIESKDPEKTAENILGEWIPVRTVPVVITNNNNATLFLESLIKSTFTDNGSSNSLIITEDSIREGRNDDGAPYEMEDNLISWKKNRYCIFSIRGDTLTIDHDLRSALIWIGLDGSKGLSVKKVAARVFYKKRDVGEEEEESPTYDGNLFGFIEENLVYPPVAVAEKTEGTVYVLLFLDKEGNVMDVLLNEISETPQILNDEALRVTKLLPGKWTPRKVNGTGIETYINVPIIFKLPKKESIYGDE